MDVETDEEKIYGMLKEILNKVSWVQGAYALLRCVKEASIPSNPDFEHSKVYYDALNHLQSVIGLYEKSKREEAAETIRKLSRGEKGE